MNSVLTTVGFKVVTPCNGNCYCMVMAVEFWFSDIRRTCKCLVSDLVGSVIK